MDDLDKQIINHLSQGTHSYKELAKVCGVHRNTIIRRITNLEEKGKIRYQIGAMVDYDKLNLASVIFGLNVNPKDLDRTTGFLKRQKQVKLLWKTYGAHDLVFAILCDKANIGVCIFRLKDALAKLNIECVKLDSSASISWEKIDLNPY